MNSPRLSFSGFTQQWNYTILFSGCQIINLPFDPYLCTTLLQRFRAYHSQKVTFLKKTAFLWYSAFLFFIQVHKNVFLFIALYLLLIFSIWIYKFLFSFIFRRFYFSF